MIIGAGLQPPSTRLFPFFPVGRLLYQSEDCHPPEECLSFRVLFDHHSVMVPVRWKGREKENVSKEILIDMMNSSVKNM